MIALIQQTGIYPNTLRSYLKDYQTGGIDKLKEINFYQPRINQI